MIRIQVLMIVDDKVVVLRTVKLAGALRDLKVLSARRLALVMDVSHLVK